MRNFDDLNEREVLARAISLEEEDARIYEDLAATLQKDHPQAADEFRRLRADEDGHRHRLLELFRERFGDHVPLVRRRKRNANTPTQPKPSSPRPPSPTQPHAADCSYSRLCSRG